MDDELEKIDAALLEVIQTIAENNGLTLEYYIRRLFERVMAASDLSRLENTVVQ